MTAFKFKRQIEGRRRTTQVDVGSSFFTFIAVLVALALLACGLITVDVASLIALIRR